VSKSEVKDQGQRSRIKVRGQGSSSEIKDQGQRSRIKVVNRPDTVMAKACMTTV